MPDVCELRVGGQIYGGWTDIEIQRGLEQIAGQFTLQVTDRWPGQPTARPIRRGQACTLTIDKLPVLTGWIDEIRPGYDAQSTWLTVTGRDKTADLVDCSAIFKSGQWKHSSFQRIAQDLLGPFGMVVAVGDRGKKAAGEPIASFNIEEGETVFDCLERAARLKALMMWTDGRGRLVIDLPGLERAGTALVEGQNILRMDGNLSGRERYSQYIVKGQHRGHSGSTSAKGVANDDAVGRYRPLIVLAEDQVHGASAQQRANWECTVRAGRGNRATIRTQSWRQAGDSGPLWAPGQRVTVTSPRLHLDAEMLIASVTYLKNATDGTVADIEIADPRAFDRLAGVRTAKLRATRTGDKSLGTVEATDKPAKKKGGNDYGDWGDL